MKPIVAIVGRPNVGKSTLFNRILGKHKAIVHDEPGVTRDLNFAEIEEMGRSFTIVDTGGFETETEDVILRQVREQTRLAIEDSDVIVFVMDGRTGPTPQDSELVDMLRKAGRPVIYAANKIDSERLKPSLGEFYTLGIPEVMPVSAEHGAGVNELIDEIIKRLPEVKEEAPEEERIRVAIVGRPNVGKSSLLNRLIGKQRSLVSDIAGTTRDPVDTPFDLDGRKYLFVDTAGIRKKNRVSLTVESYCVIEAIKAIDRSDCVLLVLDGKDGVKMQDEKIAGLIEDRKRCCVIVVNKWDVVEKDQRTADHVAEAVRQKIPFLAYAPVVFTSALTGQRVSKLFGSINTLIDESRTKFKTSELNQVLGDLERRYRHPAYKGREVRFYYITQTGISPPSFIIFSNIPEGVSDSYKRYLVNGFRESLGIKSVPIKFQFRQRE